MELLLISLPLSIYLFQVDMGYHYYKILWLILFTLIIYFKKRLININNYPYKGLRIYNLILLSCFTILWQLIFAGIYGISFGEGILFPDSIAQYLAFIIFLIPILFILEAVILSKQKESWKLVLIYLFSPTLYIYNKRNGK